MRIEHVAIWCMNLEVMREFYMDYFSAKSNDKYVNAAKGFESYFLSFDTGVRLELMGMRSTSYSDRDPDRQLAGLAHLAISAGSEEQVDELTERLREGGYEVVDGPRRTGDGYYESVLRDPEYNPIEITV